MLLSISWLQEFVPLNKDVDELAHDLTMLGLEIEGVIRPYEHLAPLVVGHVSECDKHPDADKLSVCKVDVGDEVLDIVCGAPNVAKGQKVVVIKVGSSLPDGTLIKKTKIRNQPSHGMICSERELNLSTDHGGIMVLDESAVPGTSILDVLPLDRVIFDVSITPNRGDCLSVLGIAREVAMFYDLDLRMPEIKLREEDKKASEQIEVEIQKAEKCYQYYGRIMENLKNGKSPAWMRYRLNACGIRAISSIVDVTNYVMLELGQPMHSFDLDKISGKKIIVRDAHEGEKMETLDDQVRNLMSEDIVIADEEKGLALGGVMGGASSEVSNESRRILLEGAVFNPSQVRRSGRRLGLSSEASFRFERGVDQNISELALERAASLLSQICGASILKGYTGKQAKAPEKHSISFSVKNAEALLGVELSDAFCEKCLKAVGCKIEKAACWTLVPPSSRPDLVREADLIEEIARIYGVDKIPAIIPAINRPLARAGLPEPKQVFLQRVKHWAASHAALHEAICYSFSGSKFMDLLGIEEEGRVYLKNPLSEDLNVMRTYLAPNLLTALGLSLDHDAAGVRIFEVASVYHEDKSKDTGCREDSKLGIALTGARSLAQWSDLKGQMAYEDLKGIVELFADCFGLKKISCEVVEDKVKFLLPCVEIKSDGKSIGYMGRVKNKIREHLNAKKDIWYAELDLELLYEINQQYQIAFATLASYPPVRRDITFIAPKGFRSGSVIDAVKQLKINILEDLVFIDSFEPKDKEEINLTYRLTFRSPERTLKENEADKQRDLVAQKLCEKLFIKI